MKNSIILTIDLEYWFDSNVLQSRGKTKDEYVLRDTQRLIYILNKHKSRATFFVLGDLAEKYPEAVRLISESGFEVACHQFSHRRTDEMTKKEFELEIEKSISSIKKITGKSPKGFRAPNFSINTKSLWALEVLEKRKFEYDSSVQPVKSRNFNCNEIPQQIYKIDKDKPCKSSSSSTLLEIPVATLKMIGLKIPVGGGIYFRIIPFALYKRIVSYIINKRPFVFYIHRQDLFDDLPRIRSNKPIKIAKYFNIRNSIGKFEWLLENYQAISIEDYLNENR